MTNKIVAKELLSAVQNTVKSIKGNILNDELVESLRMSVQPIADFYRLSVYEAIIFSVYLENGFRNRMVSMDRVLDIFGKDLATMAEVNETLEFLEEKKLLIQDVDNHSWNSRSNSPDFKSYKANVRMVLAMVKGDSELIEPKKIDSFIDFLDEVAILIGFRTDNSINTDTLLSEVKTLLHANKHLNENKWILSIPGVTDEDTVILLNICYAHFNGENSVDFDSIVKEIFQGTGARIKYKTIIKNGTCSLLKNEVLEFVEQSIAFLNYVKLTENTRTVLLGENTESVVKKVFKSKTGILFEPESIALETLFYNEKEKEQLDVLIQSLHTDNYNNIVNKMKENNMVPGFTCLFYGFAGTGKTATVKQIAAITGRPVMMVDMEKIRSKWVGDSEKNLSKIFTEYDELKDTSAQTPILLFNEADALLGKRINVSSSVDQMNNTMQNILLQELEDFDGIFVATTNLAKHLDPAFDRRLLYKIEFNKPSLAVREKILGSFFPQISPKVINELSNTFELTGGQINNIKKKLLVKTLLQPNTNSETYLYELCSNEVGLSSQGRNIIGFKNIY